MRAGGGKAKGAAYEREICKKLSLWVSQGKREDLYWRSAMSGGRATVGKRAGKDIRQTGDIACVDKLGHMLTDVFFIECKRYRRLKFDAFFLEGTGPLAQFWKQARKQARQHLKRPMLIARENGRRDAIVLIESYYNDSAGRSNKNKVEIFLLNDLLKQHPKDVVRW